MVEGILCCICAAAVLLLLFGAMAEGATDNHTKETEMKEPRDLEDMMNILTLTIVRHKAEEEFFRRSAQTSNSLVAKVHFSEISRELSGLRKNLEARKRKLAEELSDTRAVGQKLAN